MRDARDLRGPLAGLMAGVAAVVLALAMGAFDGSAGASPAPAATDRVATTVAATEGDATTREERRAAVLACLREEGLDLPEDPDAAHEALHALDRDDEAVRAALEACRPERSPGHRGEGRERGHRGGPGHHPGHGHGPGHRSDRGPGPGHRA